MGHIMSYICNDNVCIYMYIYIYIYVYMWISYINI